MGWGREKRGRKGVSLHLLSLLFASLFPLSLRKALYSGEKYQKELQCDYSNHSDQRNYAMSANKSFEPICIW